MKKLFPLVFLLASTTMFAQTFQKHTLNQRERLRQQALNMVKHSTDDALKTSTTAYRVKSSRSFDFTETPAQKVDSTSFKYSSNRGSKFDYNQFDYNYYFPGGNDVATHPSNFGFTAVAADSIKYYDYSSGTPLLNEKVGLSYSSANRVLNYEYFMPTNISSSQRGIYAYDAQGRPSVFYGFEWNTVTNQWDTLNRRNITYNTSDKVVTDTIYTYDFGDWNAQTAYNYNYNTAGLLTTMKAFADTGIAAPYVQIQQVDYTYYASNNLKTFVISYNFGTGLELYEKDTVNHSSTASYYTFYQVSQRDASNTNWEPVYRITSNENAQNLPDSAKAFLYDPATSMWSPIGYLAIAYDANQNPLNLKIYDVAGTTITYSTLTEYFYETYNTVSVKNSAPLAAMKVFPNPANDHININWKEGNNKLVKIQILNAAGQIVYGETLNWMQETNQINISQLTSGVYFLNVSNGDGQQIYHQSILKN